MTQNVPDDLNSISYATKFLPKMQKKNLEGIIDKLVRGGKLNYVDNRRLRKDFYTIIEAIVDEVIAGNRVGVKNMGVLYPYFANKKVRSVFQKKEVRSRRYCSIKLKSTQGVKNKINKKFDGLNYK